MTTYFTEWQSPLCRLLLTSDGAALTRVFMAGGRGEPSPEPDWVRQDDLPVFEAARAQLTEYFAGRRREFDLPLRVEGTAFQRRVWEELARIPFGVTWSYGELARRIGNPSACRAVGLANGKNPLGIIVPCHRVIGANGTLTGYGGGLERKQTLLDFEARVTEHGPQPLTPSRAERATVR